MIQKLLEATGISVLHAQAQATVEIHDPDIAEELSESDGLTLQEESHPIYTIIVEG